MSLDCRIPTGSKGNQGMFIDKAPKIFAAGLPTAQPNEQIKDSLQHYLLKDHVDALISDALLPSSKPNRLPVLRHPAKRDMRHAAGPYDQVAELINPPMKTKFQTLVEDLKETSYDSYWKKQLGTIPDSVPKFPAGFDVLGTTFGKKTPCDGSLYDIVMPQEPLPDRTPRSKWPGVQSNRHYCAPPFNPDLTYGYRTQVDKRGIHGKCCLSDDRIKLGTAERTVINSVQANFKECRQPVLSKGLAPNHNISDVPEGYAFGLFKPRDNLLECLTYCKLNPGKHQMWKCLRHLNTLRRVLSTRFLPTFFHKFYLAFKKMDNEKSGWLPKNMVYDCCASKLIKLNPDLIEPLLSMWKAYDGSQIEYNIFVKILDFKKPLPEIPKIPDISVECLDYRTTYTEMVESGNNIDTSRKAGVPLGVSHVSEVSLCLSPSIFTLHNVDPRAMYANREPHIVRRVFEATGEKFTDESFNAIWKEAKKYHSQGWVCYATFRRAMQNLAKDKPFPVIPLN